MAPTTRLPKVAPDHARKEPAPRRRGRIAYQGEPGANSHLACTEAYGDYEPVPCPTFEDVLAAVNAGDVKYARKSVV